MVVTTTAAAWAAWASKATPLYTWKAGAFVLRLFLFKTESSENGGARGTGCERFVDDTLRGQPRRWPVTPGMFMRKLFLISLFALALVLVFTTPLTSAAQQSKLDIKAFVGVGGTTYVAMLETGCEGKNYV